MRSNNPALNSKIFSQTRSYGVGQQMTLQGTVNKAFILLFCILVTASWIWSMAFKTTAEFSGLEVQQVEQVQNNIAKVAPFMTVGAIVGFIFALITIFKKSAAPVTAPIYALCEGLFLGGISAIFEMQYPGIVMQAVALTFGTLFCLLMIYKSGMIKVTDNFRLGIVAATGAICLIYLVTWILSWFGASIPYIHGNGMVGILFSLFVVTIAALNLVLDFDFIEKASQMDVPKYMEWYAAFGLMVTLVWLYIEILKLLSKLRSRR